MSSVAGMMALTGSVSGGVSGPAQFHFLVIAGGGSGGVRNGGGGGAGGYRTSWAGAGSEQSGRNSTPEAPLQFEAGDQFTVTVGAGGAARTQTGNNGTSGAFGNPSVFDSITSERGGSGGHYRNTSRNSDGGDGGSGGGAANNNYSQPGDGTAGQGHDGVRGGGGAGSAPSGTNQQIGGAGLSSTITGVAVTRAGGGGAFNLYAGGSGGGGAGGNITTPGTAGAANTGSGGGGTYGSNQGGGTSGAGGSGVVILRYPSSVSLIISPGLTGSTDSTSISGTKITTFTAGSGTVTVAGPTPTILGRWFDALVVGGGGGGATNAYSQYRAVGSGGGGEVVSLTNQQIAGPYTITIGKGGDGTNIPSNSNNRAYTLASSGDGTVFGATSVKGGGGGFGHLRVSPYTYNGAGQANDKDYPTAVYGGGGSVSSQNRPYTNATRNGTQGGYQNQPSHAGGGSNGNSSGGNGGPGTLSSITGASVRYGPGGNGTNNGVAFNNNFATVFGQGGRGHGDANKYNVQGERGKAGAVIVRVYGYHTDSATVQSQLSNSNVVATVVLDGADSVITFETDSNGTTRSATWTPA